MITDWLDPVSYKLGQAAGGGGGSGYTVVTTTYTQASATNMPEIPMPAGDRPAFVDILNAQSGTQYTDFANGTYIHGLYAPVPDDDLDDVTDANGVARYRHGSTGNKATGSQTQTTQTSLANGEYRVTDSSIVLRPGSGCDFHVGDSFTISWYYAD